MKRKVTIQMELIIDCDKEIYNDEETLNEFLKGVPNLGHGHGFLRMKTDFDSAKILKIGKRVL